MSQDFALPMRAAVLAALKRDAGVTALIPKTSLYTASAPAERPFPFGIFGPIIGSPFRASGLDASTFRFSYHGFSKPVYDAGNVLIRPAEDNAILIGSAVKEALDNKVLLLNTGDRLRIMWVQTTSGMDGDEKDAWRATATFTAEVAG